MWMFGHRYGVNEHELLQAVRAYTIARENNAIGWGWGQAKRGGLPPATLTLELAFGVDVRKRGEGSGEQEARERGIK